jgi:hypothetical protein
MTTTQIIQDIATRDAQPQNHRRNGKIARLPKEARDIINHMLDDGLPSRVIIDELGDAGRGLNAQNLTNWVQGGYEDYLQHQEAIEQAKIQAEFATELLRENGDTDPAAVHRACQLIAAVQLLGVLKDHGEQALTKMLEREPARYLPMLNTLSNMSRADVQFQKRQDTLAARQTLGLLRAASNSALSSPIKLIQTPAPVADEVTSLRSFPVAGKHPDSSQIKPNQAPGNTTEIETPASPSQPSTSKSDSSPIKLIQTPARPTKL